MHGITSARYANPVPPGGYGADADVIAVRNGIDEQRRANDDIEGGGMLAYIASGGVIGPYAESAGEVEKKIQLIASMVDQKAEEVRLKYITAGDGMAITYREKFEQAELVNEIGETAANALSSEERIAAYPTLAASVGLEAPTLWECAQLVRSKYAQFAQLSHPIEKTRLSGKASVSAATTVAEAQAAYEAITWTV